MADASDNSGPLTDPPRSYLLSAFASAAMFWAVSVAGFLLRVWHVNWGGPFSYYPGETRILNGALGMLSAGEPSPNHFDIGALIFYLEAGVASAVNWVTGLPLDVLHSPEASPDMFLDGQWAYLLSGRLVIALLGGLTCGLVSL
ncbi:MAG: hypothetical protein KC561_18115, partial [Myxococcales bacterium]|nr:hypothetical protein [Myxococcales bacterium]